MRALLLFTLPTVGSTVLPSINAVWVGNFRCHRLAARPNTNLIIFMLFSLVFGFGMATTVLMLAPAPSARHTGRSQVVLRIGAGIGRPDVFVGDSSGNLSRSRLFSQSKAETGDFMVRMWSREHLERRIDRYYLLAAATKIAEIRQMHLARARHYRRLLASALALPGIEQQVRLA